jgi:TetR/AcrR family transcriptional regulator, transcriptional repressor for nem operon
MGFRQTAELDEPGVFLTDFEKMWALMLPGFVRPERVDYFHQFISRRTKIAIGSTSALAGSG